MKNLINATDEEMTKAFALERLSNDIRVGPTELPENIRLILQCAADDENDVMFGFPMWLEGVPDKAVSIGLMEVVIPPGGSGRIGYRITENGRNALKEANESLGVKATRYARSTKYFPNIGFIVVGYPFLVPLSQAVERYDGVIVVKSQFFKCPQNFTSQNLDRSRNLIGIIPGFLLILLSVNFYDPAPTIICFIAGVVIAIGSVISSFP